MEDKIYDRVEDVPYSDLDRRFAALGFHKFLRRHVSSGLYTKETVENAPFMECGTWMIIGKDSQEDVRLQHIFDVWEVFDMRGTHDGIFYIGDLEGAIAFIINNKMNKEPIKFPG